VAATVGGLVVAGCGGGSDPASSVGDRARRATTVDAGSVLAASVEKASAARSYAIDGTVEVAGGELDGVITLRGAVDEATGTGELAMDLDVGDQRGTVEIRIVSGVLYLRMSGLDAGGVPTPRGDRWLVLDPTAIAEGFGADEAAGTSPGAFTGFVGDLLASLRGVADEVEDLGRDEVRGVPTTRYRADVDLARALDRAPADQREDLREALEQLGAGRVPYEVWIDDEGLPRRLRVTVDPSAFDLPSVEGLDGSAILTVDLYDFGRPVAVEAPPAEETVDFFSALLEGLGGRFQGD
jgi:hypothetical protein